jgi:hypothetical protein
MRTFDDSAYDPLVLRRHAESFSTARFEKGFVDAVTSLLAEPA